MAIPNGDEAMNKALWAIIGFIIAVLMFCVTHACYAESWMQVEAGLGGVTAQLYDGRWEQQGAPGNTVVNQVPVLSLGLTGNLYDAYTWGVGWHADYEYIGTMSASCQCTVHDEDYNRATHTVREGADTTSFSGSGHMQGVVLSMEPWKRWGQVRFGAELGAFVHWDTWTERTQGQTISTPRGPYVSPVVGVMVHWQNATLSYRHYFTRMSSVNRKDPPLWNDLDAIEFKWVF